MSTWTTACSSGRDDSLKDRTTIEACRSLGKGRSSRSAADTAVDAGSADADSAKPEGRTLAALDCSCMDYRSDSVEGAAACCSRSACARVLVDSAKASRAIRSIPIDSSSARCCTSGIVADEAVYRMVRGEQSCCSRKGRDPSCAQGPPGERSRGRGAKRAVAERTRMEKRMSAANEGAAVRMPAKKVSARRP